MTRRFNWEKSNRNSKPKELINHADPERVERAIIAKSNKQINNKLLQDGIWPVGKHKNTQINQLPEKYLIWAGQNLKYKDLALTSALRVAANNELLHRYCTKNNIPVIKLPTQI